MAVTIVVAVGPGGVIGSGGRMPWHIPEDLRHFRELTMGHTLVMGRRTFEGIGKPLDGRRNIVLTREAGWHPEGVEVARSLEEALSMSEDVFVIGGGEVFRQAMPLADRIYLSHIEGEWTGDTYFPPIDSTQWRETGREPHEGFEVIVYEKND